MTSHLRTQIASYWWMTIVLFTISLAVVFLSVWVYQGQLAALRAAQSANLQSIAAVKTHQLADFRDERRNDALILATRPLFNATYANWLKAPTPEIAELLRHSLAAANGTGDYLDIILFDPAGQERLRVNTDKPPARCAATDEL